MRNSSQQGKTTAVIVIILIIIVIVVIWFVAKKPAADTYTNTATTPATSESDTTGQYTPAPADSSANSPAAQIQTSGSSDASLDQDSAALDQQMTGLNSDTSAASQ